MTQRNQFYKSTHNFKGGQKVDILQLTDFLIFKK